MCSLSENEVYGRFCYVERRELLLWRYAQRQQQQEEEAEEEGDEEAE